MIFNLPEYTRELKEERRKLSSHLSGLQNIHKHQKEKAEKLRNKLRKQYKQIADKDKKIKQLEGELEKARITINTYKQMLFEKHKQKEVEETDNRKKIKTEEKDVKTKKQNGQKKGHKGYGRKRPEKIDQQIDCFLSMCLDCGNPLKKSDSFHSHFVTDIPHFTKMLPLTTEYRIFYQWCSNCKKSIAAVPFGVIPGSRIGMNLFLMILIWRYYLNLPFNKIAKIIQKQYQIYLSKGALVGITKKARKFFGKRYDDLLVEIRGAPVKHADETTWGMDGLLYWAWIFLTEKSVYYTIEETRGKGVAEKILKDAIGILVRDGYTAYKNLSLIQQACFAHLYRKARDAAEGKGASEESKKLFQEIKQFYGLLAEDIQRPFDKKEREEFYVAYKKDMEKIITRIYQAEDAKRVVTYIKNLGDNILTALLYENVPLTNNAAEQAARQIVIGRKISGGSRSKEGVKTHAVNMSITQTILKQKLPLFETLESYLFEALPTSYFKN